MKTFSKPYGEYLGTTPRFFSKSSVSCRQILRQPADRIFSGQDVNWNVWLVHKSYEGIFGILKDSK